MKVWKSVWRIIVFTQSLHNFKCNFYCGLLLCVIQCIKCVRKCLIKIRKKLKFLLIDSIISIPSITKKFVSHWSLEHEYDNDANGRENPLRVSSAALMV